MADEQYATVNKDTRALVTRAIAMAAWLAAGDKPEINNTTLYDNGVKVVPAYLLVPVIVTKANAVKVYADDPLLAPLTKQSPHPPDGDDRR